MKRVFQAGMVVYFLTFITVAHAAVCDFNGTPQLEVWYWNFYDDYYNNPINPIYTNPQASFEEHMSTNRYFWGNDSLSQDDLKPMDYRLSQMTYSAGNANVTVKGIAENLDYGGNITYYSTSGGAVSCNESSLGTDVAEKGNSSLPNATYAYTQRQDEGNRFLVFYDLGFFGLSGNDSVDSFVTPMQITFDTPSIVTSVDLANTLYVVNSMTLGDGFAESYSYDEDSYFGITISGLCEDGSLNKKEQTFLLADFLTYADNTENVSDTFHELTYYSSTNQDGDDTGIATTVEYLSLANGILDDWGTVLLEDLGEVYGLQFSLFCSDYGTYGFNTPLYFALDNLVFASDVPEPATWSLLALGLGILFWRRKKLATA